MPIVTLPVAAIIDLEPVAEIIRATARQVILEHTPPWGLQSDLVTTQSYAKPMLAARQILRAALLGMLPWVPAQHEAMDTVQRAWAISDDNPDGDMDGILAMVVETIGLDTYVAALRESTPHDALAASALIDFCHALSQPLEEIIFPFLFGQLHDTVGSAIYHAWHMKDVTCGCLLQPGGIMLNPAALRLQGMEGNDPVEVDLESHWRIARAMRDEVVTDTAPDPEETPAPDAASSFICKELETRARQPSRREAMARQIRSALDELASPVRQAPAKPRPRSRSKHA